MKGMCNSEKVVYEANISPLENSKETVYVEIPTGNRKQGFYNHK